MNYCSCIHITTNISSCQAIFKKHLNFIDSRLPQKIDMPAIVLAGMSAVQQRTAQNPVPRPAAARKPQRGVGVQRAEPFGARRIGGSRRGRESRGRSPLAPAAEAAPGEGGSPEGRALWRPLRRRTSISEGNSIQHWKFRLIWSILGVTTVKVEERV